MSNSSLRMTPYILCSILIVSLCANRERLHAAITSSGDVSSDPTAVASNQSLTIGVFGIGEMTVDGGSSVENFFGIVGSQAGSDGIVTVDGAGSLWKSNEGVIVGSKGQGVLNISNGGIVEGQFFVTVGSSSSNNRIQFDNGVLTTKALRAEHSRLLGMGTINVEGWILDEDLTINSLTDLPTQTFLDQEPGQDITVNINWTGEGPFGVNNGNVTIANALKLSSGSEGYIGHRAGSNGSVSVTGPGTTWNVGNGNQEIFVGNEGHGQLEISNGAVVTSGAGYLGHDTGTVGAADVKGAGSTWNTDTMYIGNYGQGALDISAGGTVINEATGYVGVDFGGSGVVTVDGNNSTLMNNDNLLVGFDGNGEMHISNGGKVSSKHGQIGHNFGVTGLVMVDGQGSEWTNSEELWIGNAGSGTLYISGGGLVSSVEAVIGLNYVQDVSSSATVDGMGSAWIITGDLSVSWGGEATLNINNGGLVDVSGDVIVEESQVSSTIQFNNGTLNSRTVLANQTDLHGVGTINANGWLLNQNLTVSSLADLPTQIILNQLPEQNITVNLNWNGNGAFGSNQGQVAIANGMAMHSAWGYVGYLADSMGTVNVTGPAAEWNMAGRLNVGDAGHGTLNITNGGVVASNAGNIAVQTGSTGFVNVDGSGSAWNVSSGIELGSWGQGQGELRIINGGSVTSSYARIGTRFGSTGTVKLDGPDSSWILNDWLTVGQSGHGTLTVINGALVSNGRGFIAAGSNSNGLVIVSGPGSTWANSSYVRIGERGDGILHIENGGLVSIADSLRIESGSFVNIENGGMLALNGDADESLADFLDLIVGTSAINYWDGAAWTNIVNALVGVDYMIDYRDSGDLAGYTVLTVGTLPVLNGDFDQDGDADGADFLTWQRTPSVGELATWQANYGVTASLASTSTTVPEPSACWGIVMATIISISCRRR